MSPHLSPSEENVRRLALHLLVRASLERYGKQLLALMASIGEFDDESAGMKVGS
jgi:hypothetical protein